MRSIRKHWLGSVLVGLLVTGAQGCSSEDVPVPFNHYLELAMQPSIEKVIDVVKEVCYK